MSKHAWLGVVALTLSAVSLAAQSNEFDDRFYLSGMVGGVTADSDEYDAGIFGGLILGKGISRFVALELEGNYSELDVSSLPAGNLYERFTLGVNLVGFLLPDTVPIRPYLLVNANGHSIDFLTVGLSGAGAGAGGGAVFRLAEHWDARLDVRYNLDFINGETENGVTIPDDTFYLWSGAFGIGYRFGANPYDQDGDGVPDSRDRCPDTPEGVNVYSDGCPTDLDGDGVPDYLDKCPNTPKGMLVGPDGCELDSDADGVPDSRDLCPNTPHGVPANADGCPLDSDKDGVADELDKCPGTPAGMPVGADGCPLDSDGDGVPDYLDECPKTPAGAKVLPNGCALTGDCRKPRPGEQVDANGCALEQAFILRGVKFEFDSDRLTPEAREILNEVADTLKAYPDIDVELEGHTDAIGTDAYNLGLSERRANAVKAYLEGRGVPGRRMKPVGYGESRPIATNDTEEGREENRRVELRVIE
ncbi:MAG: OmpA family protein [Pseudomonadota bacterium]